MKIIVSDTDTTHGNSMKSIIEAYIPEAQIDVRIEDFSDSITYAINNNYHLVNRSTTGLSDGRIVVDGDRGYRNGVYSVHSLGSNIYEEDYDPSYIGSIVTVRSTNTSYGNGVEFTVTESNQSNAAAVVSGMLATIVHQLSCSFDEARKRLREQSTNYNIGWSKLTGYNNPDFNSAKTNTSVYTLLKAGNLQFTNVKNGIVNISFKSFPSQSVKVVEFISEPTLSTISSEGTVIFESSASSFNYNHTYNTIKYYGLYTDSRLDSFATGSYQFSYITPGTRTSGTGLIKFKGDTTKKILIY